jgi:hypothetical protein
MHLTLSFPPWQSARFDLVGGGWILLHYVGGYIFPLLRFHHRYPELDTG